MSETRLPIAKPYAGFRGTPNPGGRLAIPKHIKEIARELTPKAMRALEAALKKPGERVGAATVILQYAWGKPAMNVNVRVINDITELSEDELRAIAGLNDGRTIDAVASDSGSDCGIDE